MPPRAPPKTFILLIKTHKLTVLIDVASTSTVGDIKNEVLDALQSSLMEMPNPHAEFSMDTDEAEEWVIPKVATTDEFELARQVKEKGRPTGRYEKLEDRAQLKSVLSNWDPVFIQFKDPNGASLPVKVSLPPIFADEEEDPSLSAARKGKRKAE